MYTCDFHLHSAFSHDSKTPLSKIVKTAVEKNLTQIGIAEHVDFDPADEGCNFFDYSRIKKEIERLQRIYPHMAIKMGCEVSVQPEFENQIWDFLKKNELDFVIGAVHFIGHELVSDWAAKYETIDFSEYIEALLYTAGFEGVDIIAHLDYPRKFIPDREYYRILQEHYEGYKNVLKRVVDNGKCLEINTAASKYDLGTYPSDELIETYFKEGGKHITVGSDAHSPEFVGYKIVPTIEKIKERFKLREICTFANRRKILIQI